ncbi:MAG TPA: hypothetical protein VFC43_00575 [Methanoregula sp.]|nr:hypothetical protein [Methanoregula sp.]
MRSWILCGNRKIDHPAICAERFDTALLYHTCRFFDYVDLCKKKGREGSE